MEDKRLLPLAMAIIAATGTQSSYAQSSVSLYGLIDSGYTYVSNVGGASRFGAAGCIESGCRVGFAGSEDLGGGIRSIFVLETGFSSVNGTTNSGGTFFGRKAFVGFSSNLGTLTAGRQYATMADMVGPFESGGDWAAGGKGYGEHPDDLDNLDNTNRVNNSIKYTSPEFAGFKLGGFYSLGGVAGDFTRNQIASIAASYARGPLSMAIGYQTAKDPNYSFFGTNANADPTGNNMRSGQLSGYATAASQQIFAAGAAYKIGPYTLGMVYSNVKFSRLGSVAVTHLNPLEASYRGNVHFNTGEVNLKYNVSPALLLGVGAFITVGSGANDTGKQIYRQVNVGADYFLSKATDLYALVDYQRASGVDSTGAPAVAYIDGTSPASGKNQLAASLGIRHRF